MTNWLREEAVAAFLAAPMAAWAMDGSLTLPPVDATDALPVSLTRDGALTVSMDRESGGDYLFKKMADSYFFQKRLIAIQKLIDTNQVSLDRCFQ